MITAAEMERAVRHLPPAELAMFRVWFRQHDASLPVPRSESAVPPPPAPAGSLLDLLAGYVGVAAGSHEPFSQDCGQKFADGLAAGRPAGP